MIDRARPSAPIGKGGLAVCDVMGYNYMDPQAEAFHKANPDKPVIGTETVSAVGTRGIYVTDRAKGYGRLVRSVHDHRARFGRRLVAVLQCAAMARGRFRVDGVRLSRRAVAERVAEHQLAVRRHRHLRVPERLFLLLPVMVDGEASAASVPALELAGLEGKEIAVWVHSNLDSVELFLNGESLGAKEVPKDSHVAWNVKYTPGTIEARGYKGGKQVMTAKRETTGRGGEAGACGPTARRSPPTARTSRCSRWKCRMPKAG